ncbi:MAG: methylated-DNA--[protein]-cysteine S-methyltransferase [Geminicoccaceae bacterium]
MTATLQRATFESPIGRIMLFARDGILVHLDFEDCPERIERLLAKRFGAVTFEDAPLAGPVSALEDYFAGDIAALTGWMSIRAERHSRTGSWLELRNIPAGETASYADMAVRIGNPKGVRAVGRTNGLNPIALVLPCHRVIGKDGSLTGYAGGLERKQWLLRHEGAVLL